MKIIFKVIDRIKDVDLDVLKIKNSSMLFSLTSIEEITKELDSLKEDTKIVFNYTIRQIEDECLVYIFMSDVFPYGAMGIQYDMIEV